MMLCSPVSSPGWREGRGSHTAASDVRWLSLQKFSLGVGTGEMADLLALAALGKDLGSTHSLLYRHFLF